MKYLLVALVALSLIIPTVSFAHGGGCRKDSLPGQCCHTDHRTGEYHCH